MPTAYSYTRMSTVAQSLRGESAKRQLNSARAYCKRNGITLDESIRLQDLGVSAFRSKNAKSGALSVFLEAVESGRIPPGLILIVESLDRITRDDLDVALQLFLRIIGAGVDIVTLTPERRHTKVTIKDIVGLIEPILIMSRANEESELKSERITKDWAKRHNAARETGKVVGKNTCPWWLDLVKGKFVEIPDRVALVRQMYQWKDDGVGVPTIAKRLNELTDAPKPRFAKHWTIAPVANLLKNRSVLGAYQPKRIIEGKKVVDGMPIEGYYPAIIEVDQFQRVQANLKAGKRGRSPTNRMVNLFTGLLYNAIDHHPVYCYGNTHIYKGKRHIYHNLFSAGCFNNIPGADRSRIKYETFEKAFLTFVKELDPNDFARVGSKHDEIAAASGLLAEIEHHIKTIKARMKVSKEIDHYLDLLDEREAERKATVASIEKLKAQGSNHEVDAIGETKSMIDMLREAEGDENNKDLRYRIKAKIAQMVERIDMLPVLLKERGKNFSVQFDLTVTVKFQNGMVRVYRHDHDAYLLSVNLSGKPETVNGQKLLTITAGVPQEMPIGKFVIEVDPDDPNMFWLVATDLPIDDDEEGGLEVLIGKPD